jgi:xanthine dehydrogenase YagS FAD-binding subunit
MAVALTALDAVVQVSNTDRERAVPITSLYRLPGDKPNRETHLGHGDLITAVDLPPLSFSRHSAYRKVRDRASFAFAVASVAAVVDVREGVVHDVRLALGAVAPKPWRAYRAEEALRGQQATEDNFRRAAMAELEQAKPLRDNGFKVPLTANLVTRVLSDLAGRSS